MAPPTEAFPASELAERVQITAQHRLRKTPVDLAQCKLLEMIQYNCRVEEESPMTGSLDGGSEKVFCEPVERLFRR